MNNQSTPTIDQHIAKIKLKSFDFTLKEVEILAQKIIKGLGLKVVQKTFHVFEPCGLTLVFILAYSHLAIHTWPESGLLHFDLVSGVQIDQKKFEKLLKEIFKKRGLLSFSFYHLKGDRG